ncbi:MAG TPA: DNA repair protein RecO [Dehalococcoidales bacterium]|nr:DNA repair protein RecO [Dehalococcoidales bacterium]
MPEAREYTTDAVIIRKTKLGEADRILTLYTPEYGKIDAVAKGVRKPKSKMAGHLELLTYSRLNLARGRNLDTIIGAQCLDSFAGLKNDLILTSGGLYAAELINQFTVARVASPALFRLFLETLERLARAESPEVSLRYFELHLLDMTGYRPQLQECVSCRQVLKPVNNYFGPAAGGVLCPECAFEHPSAFPLSVDALKVLRLFQRSAGEVISRLKIQAALGQELKTAMAGHIRFVLEREVKSANWMEAMRNHLGPPKPE